MLPDNALEPSSRTGTPFAGSSRSFVPKRKHRAVIGRPSPREFWRRPEMTVHHRPGEKLFCFTSVFLPAGISTTLYHHWLRYDAEGGRRVSTPRIGFPIRGGRRDGYRGYTYKRNLPPGGWKVLVESEDGRSLGSIGFSVLSADSTTPRPVRAIRLV